MAQLLVSVRSADEAASALYGGADLIDVKEPARGALGRADDETVRSVASFVAGRAPISAALGELVELGSLPIPAPVHIAKAGLAGAGLGNWRELLKSLQDGLRPVQLVPVAYADWREAKAPGPAEVLEFAIHIRAPVFLIDTWAKAGRTLLQHCTMTELAVLGRRARLAGVRLALAGSLGEAEIRLLLPLEPDIIAVRGAVCGGGRQGNVKTTAVRRLAGLVHSAPTPNPITRTDGNTPAMRGNQASTTPADASCCQLAP